MAGLQDVGCRLFVPILAAAFRTGQAHPGLDAHEMGLAGLAPQQGIGEAGNIADHRPARILFIKAQGFGTQIQHAMAVIGKKLLRNGNFR